MNVQASNLALIFGPETEAGKVVRVLWPFRHQRARGTQVGRQDEG